MKTLTLNLPMPPSVNALYVNRSADGRKGRMLSKPYLAWRKEAEAALWLQKPLVFFPGRVAIEARFGKTKGLRDMDGNFKAIGDFLVRHDIIVDDNYKYIRSLKLEWDDAIVGCRITITELP